MAYDDTIKKTLPMITSTFGSFLQNLFGGQLPSIQPQVMSDQDGFTNRDSLINRGIIPGNDTAANSGYALPSIMNSADLGTGRTPPPIVPGSVGLQAAPPIADASTAPPPPINAIPNTPEFQMYQTQRGTAPPPTPLPIIQQGNAPDSPELQQRLTAQDYAPAIAQQPAPDQPTMMEGGNAYHAPVYEAGRERPIRNWFQPGAPDGTPPVLSVPGAATPASVAATPQTDEEKYKATYRSYNRGTWKLDDGSITHDPKKYQADIDAHPKSTVREVKEAPGADRKSKWSILEKLGNAALGWAQGGIVGGIQGATDRNWWRKQQDAAARADLLPKIKAQQAIDYRNAQTQNVLNERINRDRATQGTLDSQKSLDRYRTDQMKNANAEAARKADEAAQKPADQQAHDLLSIYQSLPTFDTKNDPLHKQIRDDYKRLRGIDLPDKAPDKPIGGTDLDEGTINSMLGVPDDAHLANQAAANLVKGDPTTKWNTAALNHLVPPEFISNGALNVPAFMAKKNDLLNPDPRLKDIDIKDLMTKVPDNYDQRKAAEIERLRGGQKDLAAEAATFRAALKTHRPSANAVATPIATVVGWLKTVLSTPGTKAQRDKARKDFYEQYLPNVKFE